MRNVHSASPAAGLLGLTILGLAGCGRPALLASGPIEVQSRPTVVKFDRPVTVAGPGWELCFEFDRSGDSHSAGGLQAVLLTTSGVRVELGNRKLDRRGEAIVCLEGDAEFGAPATDSPAVYGAVELRSEEPLRLRGIRGGSRP